MKVIDTVYGFIALFMAILAIVTRFSLAKYKKDGVTMLNILYGLGIVSSVIYMILTVAIVGVDFDATSITGMAVQLAIICANYTYYKKRAHMFH